MITINRILCPIDFSEFSRHALAHAVRIAGWYESDIIVLHVFNTLPPVAVAQYPANIPVLPPIEPAEVRKQVQTFCEPLITSDVKSTIAVEEGEPVKVITAMANDGVDLLIMGTHGRGGFERLLLGSVAEKVLRTARCPVLTIPRPVDEAATDLSSLSTIVCAVDFGESATLALEYALALAREADARVVLLHVVEALTDMAYLMTEPAVFSIPGYQEDMEREATRRLTDLIPADARNWCRPETRVVSGNPRREILKEAQEAKADLIVMGVHGRGAIDLMLFGSTAHHVIRNADAPVLTLRTPGK